MTRRRHSQKFKRFRKKANTDLFDRHRVFTNLKYHQKREVFILSLKYFHTRTDLNIFTELPSVLKKTDSNFYKEIPGLGIKGLVMYGSWSDDEENWGNNTDSNANPAKMSVLELDIVLHKDFADGEFKYVILPCGVYNSTDNSCKSKSSNNGKNPLFVDQSLILDGENQIINDNCDIIIPPIPPKPPSP